MKFLHIQAMFLRYLYPLKRGLFHLCDLIYWPICDIVLWGITASWIALTHQDRYVIVQLLTSLVLWQMSTRGSLDISYHSLVQELWHKNMLSLFSTPLRLIEWLIAVLCTNLLKILFSFGLSCFLIYYFYDISITSLGVLWLPCSLLAILWGWSMGLYCGALLLRFGSQVEPLGWMIPFLFAPCSAVFYPLKTLPLWAQSISKIVPLSYLFETVRYYIEHHTIQWNWLLYSLGLVVLYLILSVICFIYAFKRCYNQGLGQLK